MQGKPESRKQDLSSRGLWGGLQVHIWDLSQMSKTSPAAALCSRATCVAAAAALVPSPNVEAPRQHTAAREAWVWQCFGGQFSSELAKLRSSTVGDSTAARRGGLSNLRAGSHGTCSDSCLPLSHLDKVQALPLPDQSSAVPHTLGWAASDSQNPAPSSDVHTVPPPPQVNAYVCPLQPHTYCSTTSPAMDELSVMNLTELELHSVYFFSPFYYLCGSFPLLCSVWSNNTFYKLRAFYRKTVLFFHGSQSFITS